MGYKDNTAKIYVEITNFGEIMAFYHKIDQRIFDEYLGAIHKTTDPMVSMMLNKETLVVSEEKERSRKEFAKMISDEITDSFMKYFETKDTVNGFPVKKST